MGDITEYLRSPEGKRRGGRTRAVGESQWGKIADPASVRNVPGGEPAYNTAFGSHDRAPPKPLQPGASEGNPHGFKPAGAPTPRVAVQPKGMKGRR